MRSLAVAKLGPMLLAVWLASISLAQTQVAAPSEAPAAARLLFRQGDFRGAAAAYQKIIVRQPSPHLYASLVQSLLKLDDVKSAEEVSRRAQEAFPHSALAHATRGDVYFRRGLLPEAGTEYKTALNIDETCARAWLGQGKMDAVLARRSRAREAVAKAHELDPDDGDALYEWAIRQPYPENVAALEKHLSQFRSDPEEEGHERDYMELLKALAGRKVWILNPEVTRSELKLESLTEGPGFAKRGYGLRVSFNDRAAATLLLDTGSSGVTITRKFAEKIGARKLSEQALEGVGKSGAANGYQAWVDKVVIGDLQFHDCLVHVAPNAVAGVDGLIGTDVFVKFLVTIDFPARRLRLDPLFAPAAADNDPPAEAQAFSQAFGFGHFLLLRTRAGDKASGLFVIDTGGNISSISPELAKQLSQMRLLNAPVMGMSGSANSTFIADNVILQFGKWRRREQRLITVDLHSVSKDLGTEISGQIGFSSLEDMKLVIDYRDGLVGFEDKNR
jgi:tetratricopeptide (TPR) repeat protein